jgi:hypothetical protein
MRIHTLAIAAFMLAAPAASMAASNTTAPLAGETNIAPVMQLDMSGNKAGEVNRFAPVSRYWRCPRRRGYRVTHMTFRRGRAPLCHYRRIRIGYQGRGWRATRAAWRHCRRKYGHRVIRALESRTRYRCIYRRHV